MMKSALGLVALIAATVLSMLPARAIAADVGPSKGSLVVVGGAMKDETIVKRIIDLAGGPDELIVIVPTAGTAAEYDYRYQRTK